MKILATILLLLLNGCLQNTVFFGPAITVASTGKVYHAGLSYGSNIAITRITGKTPMDNIKKALKQDKKTNNIISSYEKRITNIDKVENLSNQ
tara:strand:- start:273 stop:551 length:279 start_codon:yes stop_codon:yes gene_type:complete